MTLLPEEEGRRVWTSLVVGAALVPLLAYGMLWWAARTDALLLQEVEVLGVERTTRAEVLAAAGLNRPRSLLGLRNESIERGVLQLPWVRSVRVERLGHQRLQIQVGEAVPHIIAVHGSREVWLDEDGQPILSRQLTLDADPLPLVTGVFQESDTPSGNDAPLRLIAPRVSAVLMLLEKWSAIEHEVGRAEAVHVVGISRLDVETEQGMSVRLRTDDLELRLARVVETVVALRERGVVPETIVLDGAQWNWVAVRPSMERDR